MSTHHPILKLAALAAVLGLSACGGGDDSDSGAMASTLSFPLAQAYRNFYTNGEAGQYSAVLTSGSTTCNGTATLTNAKATAATFEGINGVSSTQTITVQLTNCNPPSISANSVTFLDR